MAKKEEKKIAVFDNEKPFRVMVSHYSNLIRIGVSKSGHPIYQRFGNYDMDNGGFYTLKLRGEPAIFDPKNHGPRQWDAFLDVTIESAERAIMNDDPGMLEYVVPFESWDPKHKKEYEVGKKAWERNIEKRNRKLQEI